MANREEKPDDLEAQLDDLDRRVERLKSLYEQYFQGIERLEPSMERNSLHNALQEMRKVKTRNTGLRFRINQLVARMNTYENYWNRITRQIEEGTYQRDLFKARYRSAARESEQTEKKAQPKTDEPAPAATAEEKRPPAPSQAPPGRAAAAAPSPAGLSENHIKALYDAYVTAKRRCRESTKGLTQEALAQTLRKQMTAIMNQYKCRSVEFKVVIKEGKAILKAVPKF